MYSIVLVDDHAIVREGFKRLIEMEPDLEVIAECRCADDAVEAINHRRPDLVALDLSLPDGSGLPLIEHLHSLVPDTHIVVLSMHDGEPYVSEALRRGASGYVTKGAAPEELVAGLRQVMQGETFLSSDLRQRRAERPSEALDPVNRLTAREREVFLLLAAGKAPKQVAAALGVGQKTIYIHRASLMGKLGAGSELDLYRMASERGLLSERKN
ncbi:response regulator transcription factor [Frateuria sp.]|uniref:response regulator transcription factor n=1 Tax=Frateuria sp. TaxID=2211372 RepID=UPI0017EBDBD2|nr:response regulator transcription factor [Frateuria sp.]NUR23058.1 response regulator transcription factor [Frateuria sp.]